MVFKGDLGPSTYVPLKSGPGVCDIRAMLNQPVMRTFHSKSVLTENTSKESIPQCSPINHVHQSILQTP